MSYSSFVVVKEFDKLHYVSCGWLALAVSENSLVCVQESHLSKPILANADDDYAHRELAKLHNEVRSFLDVMDVTVCED